VSAPTATLLSQGRALDPRFGIQSVEVEREVNRIADARVSLYESSPAEQRFAVSDSGFFRPGAELEIKLRYEGQEDTTIFKGFVVRHSVAAAREGASLTVELKDAATRLTHVRKSAVFRDQTDDEVFAALIRAAGLRVGSLVTTTPKHPELVQYRSTDWDFMLSRADILGVLVASEDGAVSTRGLDVEGAAAHRFQYGVSDILDLELELDASAQQRDLETVAWDIAQQRLTEPRRAKAPARAQGDLDGGSIAEALGVTPYTLTAPVPALPEELQRWADARLARSRLSLVRGRLVVPGSSRLKLLDIVELSRFGRHFDGKALVTGLRHRLSRDGWQTELRLGLSPEWFCQREGVADAPAAGLLPPISGLHVGIVDSFESDPGNEYRVKVLLPAIDGSKGSVWARLATPDAGKGRGYFFRPEAGDEVVVGFFDSDPRRPVILGAMFSSAQKPADAVGEPEDQNVKKAIVSKKGTTIGFVDAEKPALFIQTAGGNEIRVDDDAQSIQLKDQHGNELVLDKGGVSIRSAKDVKVEAKGKVSISGTEVDVK
jgi:Rhs element Vgr protein